MKTKIMKNLEDQLKSTPQPTQPAQKRKIWLGIQDKLHQQQARQLRQRRIRYLTAAASVLLLISASYFFLTPKTNQEQIVLQQYGLHQYGFPQQVNQKMSALKGTKIPKHQIEHFNALKSQLDFLDKQYLNYVEYIEQNGYQEYIGRQIQNYYEIKIELLDRIQKEIQKLNKKRDENNNTKNEVDWQI